MEAKGPLYSKSNWFGVLMAIAPFIPGVAPFIAANPEAVSVGVGMMTLVLRAVTGKPIDWKLIKP